MSLRIAITGTGAIADLHATELKNIRGVDLCACCDISHKKARDFSLRHGIKTFYPNIEDMLTREKPDALIVAVPPHAQLKACRSAIQYKIHILCERPLTNNSRDAAKLSRLAHEAGIINLVSYETRGIPEVHKAANLVKSGRLGKIMHIEASYLQSWLSTQTQGNWKTSESLLWRMTQKFGGHGVIDDLGLTLLDCVSFIAGDISKIEACKRSFRKDVPGNRLGDTQLDASDSAVIMAEMKGGALGSFHLSRWATGEVNSLRLRVYGDKGGLSLKIKDGEPSLRICTGPDRQNGLWSEVDCPQGPNIWRSFINAIRKNDNTLEPNFSNAYNMHKLLTSIKKELN
ncbi:Gfo/Idh/MocA family oxidoreductase [Lentisphaera profundi]|uniref:Gfo/Idh/MocA family oxidoreductase n=1 Tax=Lentisphaera profundi TaxID=1658616 RepID=A0ABY7VY81_9BACT|nr:Gfo/Idh/MocA family oxidoreductase [Lentisphaera profundi]WDE99047.1 Gfo/Idh/MocA family oxidoreductase [Lentisphaera profundi]